MRTKIYPVVVVILIAAFLVGCTPAASLAQSTTPNNPAAPLPAAPAGGPGVNGAAVQTGAPAPVAQTVPGMRTMTVTGTGQAALTPDMAFVTIGVQTENASISEAMATNKTQTQKVIDVIKSQGVDAKDIQTTNFSVYPNQKPGPNGEVTGAITYMVSNNVYVTVRDLNKLGTLLDTVVQNGANTISGIQFDVSDKTAALSSARKDAVKNAADLANELAGAAGVQLGQIASISVNSNSVPIPMGYGMGGGGMAVGSPVPVSAGQMIINVDVTVVYELK